MDSPTLNEFQVAKRANRLTISVVVVDDPAAVTREAEREFSRATQGFSDGIMAIRWRNQKQKPTSSGTE